ncbi:MAG: peptidase M23, partial [Algoriphagus sp. 32-45-6]
SRYNLRRFHPVQKRYKPHLGTDYAAPTGTEIRSVGDGTVVEARYTSANGNYVKIKHNGTYTTQYLHMSKIGKGIKAGTRVKQGQVIGYVGSTGLATGPHLCFRFWKNGKQEDWLKEKIPPSEPISAANRMAFEAKRNEALALLAQINLTGNNELLAEKVLTPSKSAME